MLTPYTCALPPLLITNAGTPAFIFSRSVAQRQTHTPEKKQNN